MSTPSTSPRVLLVTGASRGIGQAIAEALASAGADVAVTARDHGSLAETVKRVESHGRTGHALLLDVRDIEACGSTFSLYDSLRCCG